MTATQKFIIGNDTALQQKYGAGAASIHSAISSWVAADNARGVTTTYVAVDDAPTMATYQGSAATVGDEASHKAAVDAIWKAVQPDYIVLLGAPDIIPHITLNNPTYSAQNPTADPDQTVPSDLPYACQASYSQEPADFIGPTRVVTRLPDVSASNDPNYLVKLINAAATASPLLRQQYSANLGVSAAVWNGSTSLSLIAIFGSANSMQTVPPSTYTWNAGQLGCLSHFFNCHGASYDSRFYGQSGNIFPVAHDSSYIAGKLTAGTILAAECCYGAQLFDPNAAGGQLPICNAYLADGAYAVWGSTTVAYGPANANGQADLICQYFFEQLLAGNSVGVAALNARQAFASASPTISPTDLKTLIQFVCFGDASLHCVSDGTASSTKSMAILNDSSFGWNRPARRASSVERGQILQMFKRRAKAEDVARSSDIDSLVRSAVSRFGLTNPSITSKAVLAPSDMKILGTPEPEQDQPDVFHLVSEASVASQKPPEKVFEKRMIEIGETGGRIVMIRELFWR